MLRLDICSIIKKREMLISKLHSEVLGKSSETISRAQKYNIPQIIHENKYPHTKSIILLKNN